MQIGNAHKTFPLAEHCHVAPTINEVAAETRNVAHFEGAKTLRDCLARGGNDLDGHKGKPSLVF